MRFHLLGVGSIGSLVGFHLKRSIRAQRALLEPPSRAQARNTLLLSNLSNDPPPQSASSAPSVSHIPPHVKSHLPDPRNTSVTLHVRDRLFAKQINKRASSSILVERDGVRGVEPAFNVERSSAATDVVASAVRTNDYGSDVFSISRNAGPSLATTTYATPIRDRDNGISIISTLEGKFFDPLHSPIDSLIITTKCDATLTALKPLLPRLHPWSTVVLIQNGMGVMDTLVDRFFKDPETRPNFVLGTTTHGVWRKAPLNVVHAGVGELHFSVVPNARAGEQGFETALDAEKAAQPIASSAAAEHDDLPPLRRSVVGSGWDKFAAAAADVALAEQKSSSSSQETVATISTPTHSLLDVDGIPDVPSLRTLRHTVSSLLALPLNVHWIPIREYQLIALRKLAINACINPLTAVTDCRNGDLIANSPAQDAMWSVCFEISAVLEAQVREHLDRQSSPAPLSTRHGHRSSKLPCASTLNTTEMLVRTNEDGKPALHPSLTATALYHQVQRAVRLTAANWSSMHADLKSRRGSTEIDYINGYVSALGRGYGVETPANDLLTSLVRIKTAKVTGS